MFNKIQNFVSSTILKYLHDIRVVGLLIFGFITILVTWSGIGAVEINYNLQKEVSQLKQQNELSALQDNNLQLQNQYYTTNEYLELQSRQLLGKALPGEKLVLVPQSVAMSNVVSIPSDKYLTATSPPAKPKYQSNFEAWMNFFFHRNN